jgi:PAS domain S-box-containing protein
MAGKSKHEQTDGGRRNHPAYERFQPVRAGDGSGREVPDGPVPRGAPGEREILLAHLFHVSKDGILFHELPSPTQPGRLLDVNDRLCRMLGYTRDELLLLTLLDLVGAPAHEEIREFLEKAEPSGRLSFEVTLLGKERRPVPLQAEVNIVHVAGRRMALSILHDVTERQRVIQELERRARQLQKVTLELSEAEDRERKRLAEILHDDVQQTLAAAKFQLGVLSGRLRNDPELVEVAGEAKQLLQDAIDKSRSLSHELGPAVLSQSRLDDTFAWLARQMETKHGLVVHVQTRGRIDSSSEPVRTFLYRAARELLFNIVKHAEVAEASLRLKRVRNQLRLTISDKGHGFDLPSLARTPGVGLSGVRDRAELLGGRLKIKSAPGKGSTFLIAVPDLAVPKDPA